MKHFLIIVFLSSVALTACVSNITPPSTITSIPPSPSITSTATFEPSKTPLPTLTFTPAPNVNQTTSGWIIHDEIWRNEILISGDIFISSGVTLIIEPGTTVRFTAQSDDLQMGGFIDRAIPERVYFPNDPPAIPSRMIVIVIYGKLESIGSLTEPILFTSNSDSPSVNDWQGLNLVGKATIKNTIVEYAYWALQLRDSSVLDMKNSIFRHIATCAICTGRGTQILGGEILISENTFIDCGHEGVDTYINQNIIVRNNLFIENVVGVVANYGSEILIVNNYFYYNDLNIGIFNKSNPTVIDNKTIWNIEGINLMDFLSDFELD